MKQSLPTYPPPLADEPVIFTLAGMMHGARKALPLAASVFFVGLVFGVLARQARMGGVEATLMSVLVFAGASQFVALSLWMIAPFPVMTIILTTFVVNMRHLLMGASLRPWFSRLPRLAAYCTLFFMVDESWALTMGELNAGGRDGAFLLGSGLLLYVAWVASSIVGLVAGASIQNPAQWGLDFAFTAVFIALLAGMWRGRSQFLPWAIAAGAALAAYRWLPGEWYIVLGGLAGSITGAIFYAR
ncbi:MAG TPA: AzlC family ABC transporter permease [Ktedonobacteraceae bacterium]|nr:AzlC family ABC transporter permease [Ktedonobacteraceae bacterium]